MKATRSRSKKISIRVCFPGMRICTVSVKTSQRIKTLLNLFQNNDLVFIANGTVLDLENTFDYYQISDYDNIVSLRNSDSISSLRRHHLWCETTKDEVPFNETIRTSLNPQMANEISRIRDIHLLQIEKRPRFFNRMCQAVKSRAEIETSFSDSLFIEYDQLEEPACEPLPIMWSMSEQ